MSKRAKLLNKIKDEKAVHNVTYDELLQCARELGWQEKARGSGSHAILWHKNCNDILNFQPSGNGKAKPYQVKQLRNFIAFFEIQNLPLPS